jgi:hypothetical protein
MPSGLCCDYCWDTGNLITSHVTSVNRVPRLSYRELICVVCAFDEKRRPFVARRMRDLFRA